MNHDDNTLELLDTLVRMTQNVLDGAVTPDQVRELVGERDALMQRVNETAPTDETSRQHARALVQKLMLLDQELVNALWRPRRDAFAWLADKSSGIDSEMPHLSALLTSQR